MKYLTKNRRALYDYTVLDRFEAGIVLTGDEVKAIRAGQVNLAAAYAIISEGQLTLLNCHISPYRFAFSRSNANEDRTRILLVHKKEIRSLAGDVSAKGITLIPLAFYEKGRGIIKVEVAICKHKKMHERKEEMREKDIEKSTRRELKGKYDY